MSELFPHAIYVNASVDHIRAASNGESPSAPIEEGKRWAAGHKLFAEAAAAGQVLPLIFAQYAPLTFWAEAASIELGDGSTTYTFRNLQEIKGRRRRSSLTVESTGAPLPDNFIRSYALVRTPTFLKRAAAPPELLSELEEYVGLEGAALRRMTVHRKREAKLRRAKIADSIHRSGRLLCEVPGCGFDFERTYGEVGRGYAHVHHLLPLSDGDENRPTRLADLAVICANCHAMVHRGGACRPLASLLRRE